VKTAAVLLLGALLSAQTAWARPAEIILLRHAEKPPGEVSVHLSAKGKERARALVGLLTTNPALTTNGLPAALFAPELTPHGHARRPYETLEPLAKHLKLPVQTPYAARDYAALVKHVLQDSAYDGKAIVICWVHDYLPELAEALGVRPKPARWKKSEFDRVWVVNYRGKKASLTSLPQNLLPGDSPQ
jgi:hypothetical protein